MQKTNVMRLLDQKKIDYQVYTYDSKIILNGVEAANLIHKPTGQLFKTLVTISKSNQYYVFMVPVDKHLDLKKAANFVLEKDLSMLPNKQLLPVTGYIHGGCSPIGMKKLFGTTIDKSCQLFDTIIFSGGKIGYQVEMKIEDLKKIIPIKIGNIIE